MGSAQKTAPKDPSESAAELAVRVGAHFRESADLKLSSAQLLAAPIARAASLMVDALRAGGKILACGNGGSAADAQHFAAELVNRFEIDRPPLAISTSGNSASVLEAVAVAQAIGARVVALTGGRGGKLGERIADGDVHVNVPHASTARVQEVHLLALHCLCDAIDYQMFGAKS
jgi:D-sedoheptulose 7-phosphate isomerase